ncbi:MAG: hypothetical protein AB1394_08620, partial [Bacteroidota bacterium]
AKNTGKTTTLSFLIKGLLNNEIRLAVTSIGYDGEEIDNITLLQKPRLYFEKNTIVATSEKCLKNCEANFEFISGTSLVTPLGKVIIVRITKPGMIVLAGPNRAAALKEVINLIKERAGCDVLLVDGSLNRLSPMMYLDKLIFTTGASRNVDVKILASEMLLIEKVFSFPLTKHKNRIFDYDNSVILKKGNGDAETIYPSCDLNNLHSLASCITQDAAALYIPALLSVREFGEIIEIIKERIGDNKLELIIKSPIMLLLSGEFSLILLILERMQLAGVELTYLQKPELSAITINPFYPKIDNYHYVKSYVDKEAFRREMDSVLTTPVYNIKEIGSEGPNEIFKQIFRTSV